MNQPLTKALLEFRTVFYKTTHIPSALGYAGRHKVHIRDNCLDYYHTWYTPCNAVAVIVGDFESPDKVLDSVNKPWALFLAGDRWLRSAEAPRGRAAREHLVTEACRIRRAVSSCRISGAGIVKPVRFIPGDLNSLYRRVKQAGCTARSFGVNRPPSWLGNKPMS